MVASGVFPMTLTFISVAKVWFSLYDPALLPTQHQINQVDPALLPTQHQIIKVFATEMKATII